MQVQELGFRIQASGFRVRGKQGGRAVSVQGFVASVAWGGRREVWERRRARTMLKGKVTTEFPMSHHALFTSALGVRVRSPGKKKRTRVYIKYKKQGVLGSKTSESHGGMVTDVAGHGGVSHADGAGDRVGKRE